MANAKFSLNLGFSLGETFTTSSNVSGGILNSFTGNRMSDTSYSSGDNTSTYVSSDTYSSSSDGTYSDNLKDNFGDVSIPVGEIGGDFCIKGTKYARLGFTNFGPCPVRYTDEGQEYYTICLDGGANAETKLGGNMSDGDKERSALPQPASGYKINQTAESSNYKKVLTQVTEDLFKVGAGVHNSTGNTYLKYFYPDVKWGRNPFHALNKAKSVVAEVIIPISASSANKIYLKVVDGGGEVPTPQPNNAEYGAIDISTVICALDKYKHLFPEINGIVNDDGGKFWRQSKAKFLFADSNYNPVTGTIDNYGPQKLSDMLYDTTGSYNKFKIVAKFKTSTVAAITEKSDARKNHYGQLRNLTSYSKKFNKWFKVMRSFFFVKFMVLRSAREAAEKKLGHKLPDEIIIDDVIVKQNNSNSNTVVENGTRILNTKYKITGDMSEEVRAILSKPVVVTDVKYPKKIKFQRYTFNDYEHQLYRSALKNLSEEGKKELKKLEKMYGPSEVRMLDVKYRAYAKLPPGYPMEFDKHGNKKRRPTAFVSIDNTNTSHAIVLNRDAAPRFENAFKDIYNHYGPNIKRLIPSACVINNSLRNDSDSGMHEIGFAIDLDYWNNLPIKFGKNRTTEAATRMNKAIYEPMLDIMEAHGIRNLGRDSKRYGGNVGDWMHFQAAITLSGWSSGKVKPY